MKFFHRIPAPFKLAALVTMIAASSLSLAQENGREPFVSHGRGGFALGVCVGQTLAAQGTQVPPPAQGQRYPYTGGDPALQQAILAAIESCRVQFRTPASPTPSSEPSVQATP